MCKIIFFRNSVLKGKTVELLLFVAGAGVLCPYVGLAILYK